MTSEFKFCVAHEDGEAGGHGGGGLVKFLDALQAELDILALDIGLDPDDDGGAGFEQVAGGGERIRKADRLVLAARIGEADKGEFVAGFRAPLLAVTL